MTTNTQPTPIRSVDQLVRELLDVQDQAASLNDRAGNIRAQLAELVGVGGEAKVGDVVVTVREPNRRFNLERALAMLSDEQRALAVVSTPDAKKVKSFLPPVLHEQCMDAGTGAPIVSVR